MDKTVLCLKDPSKGNYRVISCLPLMWKLMTGINADEIYAYLERENMFLPEEQKGCQKGSRLMKDQLLIVKAVLKYCKTVTQI